MTRKVLGLLLDISCDSTKPAKIMAEQKSIFYTANSSKLFEKYFLDLRNMFANHENIRIFFSEQEK